MTDLNVKKTINHLFRGSSWLLVSQIIPTIIKYSKFKHHFIININEFGLQEKYDTLFGNLGYTDYEYWGALCPANKYFTQKKVNFFAKLKSRYRAYLSAKKMSNIIIHSEMNNSIFYFLHTPESAWCCWGNTSQIRHTKWYHFFYKDFWYKLFLDRCKIIITLTDLDKKAFEDAYGYSKIIISSYSYIYDFKALKPREKYSGNRVLIGNNACYLEEYLDIAMKLAHLQGLDLTFMCSYGVNRDSTYYQNWSKKIEEVLGHKNKISFWTNNLSLADYNKEMSSYDVYICPVKRQTGLGALTTAISLGIKCYCIGVNYDYFKKKELNIFSCLDLSDITKASLLNFDKDMRQNNILLSSEKCSCHQSVEEWENIYSNLLKNLS